MEQWLFRFKVGDFNCVAVRDHDDFEMNILLVDTGQAKVLIDAGCGHAVSPAGQLLDRLGTAAIDPNEIDMIILTHADFDHIGGAIDEEDAPAFPNARHILPRQEWIFWASEPERFRGSEAADELYHGLVGVSHLRLAQLRDRLELSDTDTVVVPGIQVIAAPGHTPGYAIVVVSSAGKKLMYIGDLIRDEKDIENDSWYSIFDYDPEQVIKTQQWLLQQACSEQMLVMASHMPFPGLGHVTWIEPGWRWETPAWNA